MTSFLRIVTWATGAFAMAFATLALQCSLLCDQKMRGMDRGCLFSRVTGLPCDTNMFVLLVGEMAFALLPFAACLWLRRRAS